MRTDAEIFQILEAFDEGLTLKAVQMRCRLPAPAIAWSVRSRIQKALAESEAGDPDPRRHDGTMPYGWWREGLAKQDA